MIEDDDDDLPLDPDDVLLQRYLDGTLGEEEALQVEFRIDEDPDFARRVDGVRLPLLRPGSRGRRAQPGSPRGG